MNNYYLPNSVRIASENETLEITKNRLEENKTAVQICENYTSQIPTYSVIDALKKL